MNPAAYARLQATDPARWQAAASSWRSWATLAGHWSAELGSQAARLATTWSGAAATAAVARLTALRRALNLFRLLCWEVDQVLSEFAAGLARAKTLLSRAGPTDATPGAAAAGLPAGTGPAAGTGLAVGAGLAVADAADALAARRLDDISSEAAPPPSAPLPPCTATPAEVRRWWDTLTPPQQRWLIATQPDWLGPLDGIPAAFRDLANRLLLDDRRTEPGPGAAVRAGLDRLADRLAGDGWPRAYLLKLDLAGDGRAVVALGDPDRAANVLTHVPGMTADLPSYLGELSRAERVAIRAAELGPAAATSTVMWLDYDAPDFVDEAASADRAEAGAAGLRRFQDGLRATHEGGPVHQTVLGHSYGSLVVGAAARTPGLATDGVVFVGSPGVGVESAARLHVPPGQVWSTTSRADVIQYAAVSPRSLVEDLLLAPALSGLVLGMPEDDLWFGRNPSDPAFGARVFPSRLGGGHLGYWDRGDPALDGITAITLGVTPP